jgi:hypothetical protein
LKKRLIDHMSTIRPKKDIAVVCHFNGQGHGIDDVGVIGVEHVTAPGRIYRVTV